MAGADIRTRDISGRQHRAAPTSHRQSGTRPQGGLPPPGKGTSSGPPGHLPLKGKAFAAPFTPPLTGEVSPQGGRRGLPPPGGGGGICEANDGRGQARRMLCVSTPLSLANARQLPLMGSLFAGRHTGRPLRIYFSLAVGAGLAPARLPRPKMLSS